MTSGTATVTPTSEGTASYTLTCTGSAGSSSGAQSAQLTVNSVYTATVLASDVAGAATGVIDPNLKNAWGLVAGPATPFWVANNHKDNSTLYDGTGKPLPLIVALPAGFGPTGIVYNGSKTDFKVNGTSAVFIFAGEGGMLAGWVTGTTAAVTYTAPGPDADRASYKGLAIAASGGNNFLYATDFHNNKIDTFDTTFAKQALAATAFVDPNLPAGYAPYGIQALPGGAGGAIQLYVTYSKQDEDAGDGVVGAGLGLVDIYDTTGTLIKRLISPGGQLNEPWGLALAPDKFGTFSNTLLVGNFGDGTISVFDASTGDYRATLSDSQGKPITSSGLWALSFGNDQFKQPSTTLFFTAGPNGEDDGVYGRIDLGATPPVLSLAP